MNQEHEIVLYQVEDTNIYVNVMFKEETFWMTQKAMANLFDCTTDNISLHLKNIFKDNELDENAVTEKTSITASDGKNYVTKIYNLDAIISVGYRVNSRNATLFRQWATQVLRNYLLKGYSINQRMDRMEHTLIEQGQMLAEHDKKIDFFKTSLPPVEGVFYDGQLFDAYKFVADLIRTATTSLILIDNYIDDTVLTLFTKRIPGVTVTIYTAQISKQLSLDLQRHNSQYEPIDIRQFNQSHDRFLIIDEKELYHIGASLKDLGKKWFAFSRIQLDIQELLGRL